MADTPKIGAATDLRGNKPLGQLVTAGDLQAKFDMAASQRQVMERQWRLNLAFYKGKQYSYYNRFSRQLQTLPTEEGDKPRYRVRLVSNQIITGAHSLLSKMLKTKPKMYATPGSGSHADLKASQMAECLLEFWWGDFQLDDSLEESLLWAIVAGQGYWKICWDEHASKQMTFTLGPDGQPITDDTLKDAFTAQLAQMGIPPQEQTVYLGDIDVEVISPFDLYLDPTVKKFSEAKWLIQTMNLGPDELATRYPKGKNLQPDVTSAQPDASLPMGGEGTAPMTQRKVYVGYFLPQPALPRGRIVTWSGNEILEDKPWDYPTNDLPFVKFPGVRIPGSVYDMSVVEQAIPLQKELNRTLSQIVEYKNLTVKPQWIAPMGSLRDRRTDEPGAIYQYNPVGGQKPEQMSVESLPAYVFNHLDNINARLADIFGRTEVTEGAVPPNVEAGVAIDLLQEMATDRIAPTIRLLELALERSGRLMLALAQRYYIEPRLMKIRGSAGGTQVKEFTKADIDGNISVHVETGSGLPRTRAGKQARVEFLIQQQIIQPDQAYKYLDSADLMGLQDQFAQDEDAAYRENQKMNQGQPLNPEAMQQAEGAIQQAQQSGQNPDTGEMFQSMEEFQGWAQQTLQAASVAPWSLDNHQVHLDVHERVVKSIEFDMMQPEQRQAYLSHCDQHMQQIIQLANNQMRQPVKTTLQLKSTVGPTTQSKILGMSGVEVSPEDTSEPPLETWVSENVPPGFHSDGSQDQNAAPIMGELLKTQAEMQQGQFEVNHAKAIALAGAQADVIDRAQKSQQSHDLHQLKLRAAAAQANAAEARARHAQRPPTQQRGK